MDLQAQENELRIQYIQGKISREEFERRMKALTEPPPDMPDFMKDIFGGFKEE